ncbi:MAG: HD domain-containing protein [Lachnospiraceae bacterium]|nr:HD domain-containing protein [Lachnospiraceae bacterium]
MSPQDMLRILKVAERLKCATRHCDTSSGRRESVAEHSWRVALMAMLLSDQKEFADMNMDRVIRMCLIHDLGEAFTGDIPTFEKTETDTEKEDSLLDRWINGFPAAQRREFRDLLTEMQALQTPEARLYKALDKLEAVIQHNESDIASWLPLEYDLQMTYGEEEVQFSPFLRALREEVRDWTKNKIEEAGGRSFAAQDQ